MGTAGQSSLNVQVVVPAYNEGPVMHSTVQTLLEAGYSVIVVDDGSLDETSLVRHLPIAYIRHAVNMGQGAALQTGMTYALRNGADVVVHFDADGQHDCGQIPELIAPIISGDADVVFGSRFLRKTDAGHVPLAKQIVLRGGILISWLMTRVMLSDTHNGFRALSRNALKRVRLTENGFAHATEILQRVREAGLKYSEVPITIRYSDYSQQKGQRLSGSFSILFDLIMAKLSR